MTRLLSTIGVPVAVVSFTVFCVAQSAPPSTRPSITGTWQYEVQGFGEPTQITLKLAQAGEKVTGTMGGIAGETLPIEDGVFKDGKLTFKTTRDFNGQKMISTFTASLHADALTGKSETVLSREFSARKAPN